MEKVSLIIRDKIPSEITDNEKNSIFVLWSDRVKSNKQIISLPLELEINGDIIRSKFLDLIYDISFKKIKKKRLLDFFNIHNNNYWWSSLLIETDNVYQSIHYNDLLKLLALEDLLKKYPVIENFKIELSDKKIKKTLYEFFCSKKRRFYNFNLITSLKIVLHIIKGFISFNKLILNMIRLKGIINPQKNSIRPNSKILFNHFSIYQIKNNKFYSKYWGDLPNLIEEKNNVVWLNMMHSDFRNNKIKMINKFIDHDKYSSNNQIHLFLESKINLKLIVKSFIDWLFLVFQYLRVHKYVTKIKFCNFYIWDIVEKDFFRSFLSSKAIFNVIYANLFEEAIKYIPASCELFILYEGQGWETILISNWKKRSRSKVFLVSHDAKRYWDMRYQYSNKIFYANNHCPFPLADFYLYHGDYAYDNMATFIPKDKLLRSEALRFNNIKSKKKNNLYKSNKRYKILILSSANISLNNDLLEISSNFLKKYSKKYSFLFKAHPDTIIRNFNYSNITLLNPRDDLSLIINHADIVFTSASTSAALDAYLSGINVITLLDKSLPNISPLYNCSNFKFCYDFKTFEEILLNLNQKNNNINNNTYSYFYTSKKLLLWKKLINY